MNKVLSLKGRFEQKKSPASGGSPKLPGGASVDVAKFEDFKHQLMAQVAYWQKPEQQRLGACLVSVRYIKVAAKSNRIRGFFTERSSNPNDLIVGAKFSDDVLPKHIITYCMNLELLQHTIKDVERVITILSDHFDGNIDADEFNDKNTFDGLDFKAYQIVKTTFQKYIVDAWYAEEFAVPRNEFDITQSGIVTLFDIKNTDTIDVLKKIGVPADRSNLLDPHTIWLDEPSLRILKTNAPYLVSMAVDDLNEYVKADVTNLAPTQVSRHIPQPKHEPVVGVIDTLFDEKVYFHEWVTFENSFTKDIPVDAEDYYHGTQVSSLIVDGPNLNPALNDGCGRFRVKHFGVASNRPTRSVDIIRRIRTIVDQNPDIHVWNLSLGAESEINRNFVSAEAAALDQIQADQNVIFVIAATNRKANEHDLNKRIGAPADSLNAMVVGSVDANGDSAEYSRRGGVLSFFVKPDVSYYGGTRDNPLTAVDVRGDQLVTGTSFAAPWITRKLAYLIEVMGLSREVAKALLVDAAIGWEPENDSRMLDYRGNGIVPVRIEDVLSTNDGEIKFVIDGISEQYDTYNYKVPVPVVAQRQPFIAKATLCYEPTCSRNQGVDYTDTELDLYFGRIDNKNRIKTINENRQVAEHPGYVTEDDARIKYRKWDNVKHISEIVKPNARPKKAYSNALWGISIKTKERAVPIGSRALNFGMVITLREINGVNRFEDFVQQASLAGWFVDPIDVKQRIDVYQQSQQEVRFDDDADFEEGDAE